MATTIQTPPSTWLQSAWIHDLLQKLDPAVLNEVQAAFARWDQSDLERAAAEAALRDLINTQGFIASAQTQQPFPGVSVEVAQKLVQAAYAAQWGALLMAWDFLRHIPFSALSSRPAVRDEAIRLIFQRLDHWGEKMADKIQQIRRNPFWLIQLDRGTLQELMPKITDSKQLRSTWMKFLVKAWRRAPDREPTQFGVQYHWAAVLATLMDAQEQGHTYVMLRHARQPQLAAKTLDSIRHYCQAPQAIDDVVREWVREVARLSTRDDSPILRQYGIAVSPGPTPQYESAEWKWLFHGEYDLSQQFIHRLQRRPYPWPAAGDQILAQGYVDAQGHSHQLDPMQARAIRFLYTTPFGILAAPPGMGKTTVIGLLHRIAQHDPLLQPSEFVVATPTGRAARVAAAAIATVSGPLMTPAATAHSWVATANAVAIAQSQPLRNIMAPLLGEGFLIVDEAFATDAGILGALTFRFGESGRFLLVGDPDQLLPVMGGAPAFDLWQLASALSPQAATTGSPAPLPKVLAQVPPLPWDPVRTLAVNHRSVPIIVDNARALWHDPLIDPQTAQPLRDPQSQALVYAQHQWDAQAFPRLDFPNPDTMVADLLDAVQAWEQTARAQGQSSVEAWHVMTWRRADARWLNQQIRQRLFPQAAHTLRPFMLQERIVQIRNDYQVGLRNGEFGIITACDDKKQQITADFGWGAAVTVSFTYARHQWASAYATTVHKAQGGEWQQAAFVNLPKVWVTDQLAALSPDEQAEPDLAEALQAQNTLLPAVARRVVYVAWTRAKTTMRFYSLDLDAVLTQLTRTGQTARQTKEGRRTRVQSLVAKAMRQGAFPPPPGAGGTIHIP